jgi:hypothetical protein
MFKVPFPDNLYGAKGENATAVINTWTVTKGKPASGPAGGPAGPTPEDKTTEKTDDKKPVYTVNATVSIFYDEDAATKKLQPLKSEQKTITFDSNPTEEALNREVELLYNPS